MYTLDATRTRGDCNGRRSRKDKVSAADRKPKSQTARSVSDPAWMTDSHLRAHFPTGRLGCACHMPKSQVCEEVVRKTRRSAAGQARRNAGAQAAKHSEMQTSMLIAMQISHQMAMHHKMRSAVLSPMPLQAYTSLHLGVQGAVQLSLHIAMHKL
ncbi:MULTISPECIES: hypothetical protein [unclassified Streptomyces]|uniref:hypothetical protein n=1 Tax=unclassified Streptomyces TaxID=2593676 RepID=UPI00226FA17D|nr:MULTISPECIES: hypothetical protein [unclassified Streptomyces]MCY0924319.1 hypothetical protein [Streptomyces sp. H27-G5]MCY0963344.1 hypothetical protein [Streptomyces sp. H27-H5]